MAEFALKVRRFKPEERQGPYWETFDVDLDPTLSVLDGLLQAKDRDDGSLAVRCSCRAAICGSCGVKINGQSTLACKTMLEEAQSYAESHAVAAQEGEDKTKTNGKPAIVVEHVTRLRGDLRPDWAQPAAPGGSYRVEIIGEPSYTMDICPTSRNGDHNYAAILAAAGRIVNAIPDVVAASPGIRTTLDLPLVTGKGLYAT